MRAGCTPLGRGIDYAAMSDCPTANTSLQGQIADLSTPAGKKAAMVQAVDYRGDITLLLADGRQLEGYLFDAKLDGDRPRVRVLPSDGGDRLTLPLEDVVGLTFSGRDTAAGKSWETWVKKYQEKKARGETANLEPEPLE